MKHHISLQICILAATFAVFALTPTFPSAFAFAAALVFAAFGEFLDREKSTLKNRLASAENSILSLTKSLSISNTSLETLKSEVSNLKVQKGLGELMAVTPPFSGNLRRGT